MIFPSDSLQEGRRKLLSKMKDGTLTGEEAFLQALDLEPSDGVALSTVGKARQEAGDLDQAQRYYWRALEAHPCDHPFYFPLSRLAGERDQRSPFGRHSTLLARRTRATCRELLNAFGSEPDPQDVDPGVPELSVYDICCRRTADAAEDPGEEGATSSLDSRRRWE